MCRLSLIIVTTVGLLQRFSMPLAGSMNQSTSGDATTTTQTAVVMAIAFFIAVTALTTLLLDRFGGALREALHVSQ